MPEAPPSEPQAAPAALEPVRLAVEVRDKKGEVPRNLTPADFTVRVDGQERPVAEIAPEMPPWRVVVYVDRLLSGSRTLRGAAGALAGQARLLAALGPVDVVVAEPEPRLVLAASREPAALDDALSRLWLSAEGRDDVRGLRRRFLEQIEATAEAGRAALAAEAAEEEARLVRRQQERMIEWLIRREAGDGPRVLFLVSDGFDVDPAAFYRREAGIPDLVPEPSRNALEKTGLEMARTAAALGWTVVPLPVGDPGLPDLRRARPRSNPEVPIGVTVPLGRRPKKEEPKVPPPPMLQKPNEPLGWMAEASGGVLVLQPQDVAGVLAGLRSRIWITAEAPASPDGRPRTVEVGIGRPEVAVRARRWTGAGVPLAVSADRVRRLLEGEDEGDLEITTRLRLEEPGPGGERRGTLDVAVESTEVEGPFRVVLVPPEGAFEAAPRLLTGRDLPASDEGTFRASIPLPEGTDRFAVLVEPLDGGSWGGEVVFPRAGEPDAPGNEEVAADAPIRPRAPAPAIVEAAPGEFRVRIVPPAGEKLAGPVDVEATVQVPSGRKLDRVEFFWNDQLAATLYDAPFRHRVFVPRERPSGYLRVEARLEDGSVAEDALTVNASGLGERVDVRLVELFVVVTDSAGRPVRGLSRDAFRVRQGGRPQEIASFENAGDLPLTLALAIDSSASMFLKLEHVREAVSSLLTGGLAQRDRALLVDFDTEPRLVSPVTRDLGSVSSALRNLTPDGSTALWEGIAFSLGQLQGLSGRKALVIYSDGIEEGSSLSYRDILRLAREVKTPIYLIVSNPRAARGEDEGFFSSSISDRLGRLAAGTGGRLFFVLPDQDLTGVYQEILSELRSQYVLTYYPQEAAGNARRDVKVEVEGRGLTARTMTP
ncbi:MAG TPA: VWA domain-containing protein [Thermoanaerobaculia bacterium]|nr:VWA domain-containing protein [Thermoanaerobaculia bacterium]